MLRIIIRDRCKFANIININICKLDKSYHLTLFSEILKENTQDFDSVIHYCVPLEKYFQNEIYMYKVFALLDMFVDCFISISIYPREHLGAYTWYCVSAAGDILSKEEFATVHRVWHVKTTSEHHLVKSGCLCPVARLSYQGLFVVFFIHEWKCFFGQILKIFYYQMLVIICYLWGL